MSANVPALPLQPPSDTPSRWRRMTEGVNNILNFNFDDSRIRTPAEIAAGVAPVNLPYLPYYAQRYGFSTSATAAVNTSALQACFNAMGQAITAGPTSLYPGVTNSGPVLVIPDGVYHINAAITIPSYVLIRANKVILVQDTAATDHFVCTQGYRLDIEGVTFVSGAHALNITGVNTDTSRVRIVRCEFQTANATTPAIYINQQTHNTLIEDCLVTDSPLFLDCDGDYVTIRNCWVNGYLSSTGLKPNATCSVNNRARYMYVQGGSWVPESSNAVSTGRWFDNRGGILEIDGVQFGAEGSGGLPIVYEFGNTAQGGSPFIGSCGTIIRGGQLACGNSSRADRAVVNLQGSVPSIIDIRGGQYPAFGKLISDQGFTSPTLSAWLASNIAGTSYKLAVTVENIDQEPSTDIIAETIPPALLPFARVAIGPRGIQPGYSYVGPLNTSVQEYLPNWTQAGVGAVMGAVCGQNLNPPSATFFNILLVSKTVNGATGDASCVVEIDVNVVGETAGPVEFMNHAKFRVAILASRTNALGFNVTTVNQDNLATGGAGPGNVLSVTMTNLTTTGGTIQLKINTAMSASTNTASWRASLVSGANANGFGFTMVSA